MNENIKIGVGFLFPAAALIAFFVSILFEQFLLGILIAVAGIFAWFLYTAVMETSMPTVTGNIIIVFGVLLSLAAFLNYGIEQNMFGGFSVDLEGLAGSAILLFFSVLCLILYNATCVKNRWVVPTPKVHSNAHQGCAKDFPA